MRTDGQTDVMKVIVGFSNFAIEPKNDTGPPITNRIDNVSTKIHRIRQTKLSPPPPPEVIVP